MVDGATREAIEVKRCVCPHDFYTDAEGRESSCVCPNFLSVQTRRNFKG
jgi:hypothetical protein